MAICQTHKQPQTRIMVCSYTENESSGLNAKNVVMISIRKVILTSTRMPSTRVNISISARLETLNSSLGVKLVNSSSKQKEN